MTRYRLAFNLSVFTAVATFLLISLGGMVHNTGSSLACPDWPLCFGQVFPEMKGGVLYEHSHRLLGALVGLCSIGLCITLWRPQPGYPPMRRFGVGVLGLVILQGVLGGITVLLKLPMLVSTGHLGLSMIVFMLVVYIMRQTWLRKNNIHPEEYKLSRQEQGSFSAARGLLIVTLVAVYVQILLGAFVRHTLSSDAAGVGLEGAIIPMDLATGKHALWSLHMPAMINMLHRYIAVAVMIMVALCVTRVWSLIGQSPRRPSAAVIWHPLGLVLLQILIGILMLALWTKAQPVQITMRTLHLAMAALVLASMFYLTITVSEPLRGLKRAAAAGRPDEGDMNPAEAAG